MIPGSNIKAQTFTLQTKITIGRHSCVSITFQNDGQQKIAQQKQASQSNDITRQEAT